MKIVSPKKTKKKQEEAGIKSFTKLQNDNIH